MPRNQQLTLAPVQVRFAEAFVNVKASAPIWHKKQKLKNFADPNQFEKAAKPFSGNRSSKKVQSIARCLGTLRRVPATGRSWNNDKTNSNAGQDKTKKFCSGLLL